MVEIVETKSDTRKIEDLRKELTNLDFVELRSSSAVEEFIDRPGTKIIVVNSTCKCGGEALRGTCETLFQEGQLLEQRATVFAGEDEEATETLRNHADQFEASSPSAYFFDGSEPVEYLSREEITETDYEQSHLQQVILDKQP